MSDSVVPLWFHFTSLFGVMLLASYLCGKRLAKIISLADAQLKAEREKALREAEKNLSVYAPSLVDGPEHDVGYYHGYVTALHRVLDLIAEDKTDE